MIDRRILAKLLEVKDLPTLPEIMNKILETIEDDSSSAQDLTDLLEQDHAISARLLRMANSAFYGLRYPVDSIRRAVVVIGFNEVRQLALATSVFDTLSSRDQFALDPEDFWMHSLGAAKAAQVLAKDHLRVKSAESCFTAGLLHDIGKYVLAFVLEDEYGDIVLEAKEGNRALREVELEKLETTHGEVGQWIAMRWRLPMALSDVMMNLHRAASCSGQDVVEVGVIALANDISRAAEFGIAAEWAPPPFDAALLAALGVSRETVSALAEELGEFRDQTRELLDELKQG